MGHAPSGDEESFERRLKKARAKLDPRSDMAADAVETESDTSSLLGLALRIGTDMVAGLAVGVAVGYGLDRWLGYRALFLVIFALLGFAAGMMNVWRIVNGSDMGSGPKDDGRSQRGSRIDD